MINNCDNWATIKANLERPSRKIQAFTRNVIQLANSMAENQVLNVGLVSATLLALRKAVDRLDRSISPLPTTQKLRSHTFKVADLMHLFPFVWAIVCVTIARYSQEPRPPFPYRSTIFNAALYYGGLTIPSIHQFLSPATPTLLYCWTIYYLRSIPSCIISTPPRLVSLAHPLFAVWLWLFGPNQAIQFHARLVGYTNLAVLALFVLSHPTLYPRASTAPISDLGYQGAFAGLNTGLQMFALLEFFPDYSWAGTLFCVLCVWIGVSRDILGFLLGACAATSFFYFIPADLLGKYTSTVPPSSPTTTSSHDVKSAIVEPSPAIALAVGKSPNQKATKWRLTRSAGENSTDQPPALNRAPRSVTPGVLPDNRQSGSFRVFISPPTNGISQDSTPRDESEVAPRPENARSITPVRRADIESEGVPQSSNPQSASVRKRSSVQGPRIRKDAREKRPTSLGLTSGHLPSPKVLPSPPIIPPTLAPTTLNDIRALTPPARPVEVRYEGTNPFEIIGSLGKSSSRISYQVRDKRTGDLRVCKSFYPRQMSSQHIKNELVALANIQKSSNTSPHVTRCFAAYIPPGHDEVEAILEYCEGGSLWSIGKALAQRKKVIGERVAGKLSEGVSLFISFVESSHFLRDSSRPCLSAWSGHRAPEHQAFQYSIDEGRHCKIERA